MAENPWLTLWFHPRITVRRLLAAPQGQAGLWLTFALFELLGLLGAYIQEQELLVRLPMMKQSSWLMFILDPLFDTLFVSVGGLLLCAFGRLLDGKATVTQIRLIMLWSWIIPSSALKVIAAAAGWAAGRVWILDPAYMAFCSVPLVLALWCGWIYIAGCLEMAALHGRRTALLYVGVMLLPLLAAGVSPAPLEPAFPSISNALQP